MKRVLTSFLAMAFLAFTFSVSAQDAKPAASPATKIEQKVGTTDVTIEYSRPSVKERAIFGELVPYGKVWRTGANAATKISFSKDVKVGGKDLTAGSYALFTTPNKESWDVHFFTYESAGANAYGDKTAAAVVTVPANKMTEVSVESFLIFVDGLRDDSGVLMIAWDDTVVGVPLSVE